MKRNSRPSLLWSCEGVTAIEFAMLAPVAILLIFGIIEFSLVMYATTIVEGAAGAASRLGKTGYTEAGMTRDDYVKNEVKSISHGLLDPAKLNITTKVYQTFNDINQPEPFTDLNHNGIRDSNEPFTDVNHNGQWDSDMGTAGLGGAGDIVLYTVTYPWHISTPLINKIIGDAQGNFPISSNIVIRNEPYNDQ